VGEAPVSSQVKPGPGGGPPQFVGHAHWHVLVSHSVAPAQPPQSGKHSGVHVVASHVSPAVKPPPQSAGHKHWLLTHTNGALQLHWF